MGPQIWLAKKIIGSIAKKVIENRAIKKMKKYIEEPNELDVKVRDLENANAILYKQLEVANKKVDKHGKTIEELEKDIAILKKDSHPSQEYICCRKCGCKIAKTKSKKRR